MEVRTVSLVGVWNTEVCMSESRETPEGGEGGGGEVDTFVFC